MRVKHQFAQCPVSTRGTGPPGKQEAGTRMCPFANLGHMSPSVNQAAPSPTRLAEAGYCRSGAQPGTFRSLCLSALWLCSHHRWTWTPLPKPSDGKSTSFHGHGDGGAANAPWGRQRGEGPSVLDSSLSLVVKAAPAGHSQDLPSEKERELFRKYTLERAGEDGSWHGCHTAARQ